MDRRRVVALDGTGHIQILEEELSRPQPGQVQVRVSNSLISPGTELGGVKRLREAPDPTREPRPFGYGNAGTVCQAGEGCEEIQPGTRLACMGNGYALHASAVNVPRNLVEPLPAEVNEEQGPFAHLAATALHAVRRGQLELGETVVVMGLGLVGQLCCQLARIAGCHVVAVDRYALRVRIAADCGADSVVEADGETLTETVRSVSRGWGADCGIIAFGGDASEAADGVLSTLKLSPDGHRMGRIVVVGGARIDHAYAAGMGNVDVRSSARPGPGYHDEAWEHGRDYPSVFVPWTTKRNMEACLRWIQEGRLNVADLVTHRFRLDEAAEACDLLVERPEEALGVLLRVDS